MGRRSGLHDDVLGTTCFFRLAETRANRAAEGCRVVVMEWRPSRSTLRGDTAPTGKEASEDAQRGGGGIRGLQKGRGCVLLHRQVVFLNQVLERGAVTGAWYKRMRCIERLVTATQNTADKNATAHVVHPCKLDCDCVFNVPPDCCAPPPDMRRGRRRGRGGRRGWELHRYRARGQRLAFAGTRCRSNG